MNLSNVFEIVVLIGNLWIWKVMFNIINLPILRPEIFFGRKTFIINRFWWVMS